MNFLFLNSARSWGGNENWIKLAAHALHDGTNQAHLAYRSELIGENFTVPRYNLPFRFEGDIDTISRLTRLVKKHGIDTLIPTKQKDYVLAGLVSSFCNTLNILRLGIVRPLGESYIKKIVYSRMCDGIIVNAQSIKDVLLQSSFMSEDKIAVIFNGIDAGLIAEKAGAQTPDRKFGFIFVTSGMLIRRKRVDLMLRAFRKFMDLVPAADAGVNIIGAGEEEHNLRQQAAEAGLTERIQFCGFLNNPYPFLAQADVFTLSSENEGISNAMLEAMALKIPVITAASGGTEEVITHRQNGFIADWQNTDQTAEMMHELYTNRELRTQSAVQGYKTIIERFTLEKMKADILSFCQRIRDSRN